MVSETGTIQPAVLLRTSALAGVVIFRNNVGVAKYPDGSHVRYGLCNGSSDCIGWESVTITPEMVGQKFARFLAVEVKKPGKDPTEDQQKFIDRVNDDGGKAGVAHSADEAEFLIKGCVREFRGNQ